jgi:hypothetical protein
LDHPLHQVLGLFEVLGHFLEGGHGEDQLVVLGVQREGLGEALSGLGQLGGIQEGGGLQEGPLELGHGPGFGDGQDPGPVAGEEFPGADELQVLLHQLLPANGKGLAIQLPPLFHLLHQGHQPIAEHDFGALQPAQLVGDGL